MVEDLTSTLSINPGDMCLAWLQVLTVSLPGVVVLLLTTALGVVEDHVHLHGLETFSLDWGCIPIFLGYVDCKLEWWSPGVLRNRDGW